MKAFPFATVTGDWKAVLRTGKKSDRSRDRHRWNHFDSDPLQRCYCLPEEKGVRWSSGASETRNGLHRNGRRFKIIKTPASLLFVHSRCFWSEPRLMAAAVVCWVRYFGRICVCLYVCTGFFYCCCIRAVCNRFFMGFFIPFHRWAVNFQIHFKTIPSFSTLSFNAPTHVCLCACTSEHLQ